MSPGPAEEVGKVASGFFELMRGNPLAAALTICNLTLLALFFYIAHWAGTNRASEFAAIQEQQREVQKLLYNCTPTNPRGPG